MVFIFFPCASPARWTHLLRVWATADDGVYSSFITIFSHVLFASSFFFSFFSWAGFKDFTSLSLFLCWLLFVPSEKKGKLLWTKSLCKLIVLNYKGAKQNGQKILTQFSAHNGVLFWMVCSVLLTRDDQYQNQDQYQFWLRPNSWK